MEINKLLTLVGLTIANVAIAENMDERPNVLIILLDDAGYNDFGFMGSSDLETNQIDNLAAMGVIFSDGHVTATVSGPSRAGILTGRYQQRFGYECNLENEGGLALSEKTIGDVFKSVGYSTACLGKWHQGHTPEYHPNERGFDYFYGFLGGARSYFYKPKGDDRLNNKLNQLQKNGEAQKFDGYLSDVLADNAVQYMDSCEKPFLMYLAFNAVHTPMEAKKEDLKRYEGHPRQMLAAMTWAVDRSIGNIVEYLKKSKKLDNTLIFFLNDNGGALTNQSKNIPLKGFKSSKFEGGHRVPFFVVWGDKFKREEPYKGLVSSLDILATAAAAAKIDVRKLDKPLDGINLIPYLEGKKHGDPHKWLCWRMDNRAAIRAGDYKLIRVCKINDALYNIEKTIDESKNIVKSNPKKQAKLHKILEKWEEGIIDPLWFNKPWNAVIRENHRDLMNNREPQYLWPGQLPEDLKKM